MHRILLLLSAPAVYPSDMVAFQLLYSKHLTGGTYLDSVSEGVIHPSTKGVVAQATDTVVIGAHSVPDQDIEKTLKPESWM